jgi:hypothetical protein
MNKQRISKKRFAICITDSEPDLELRKVYQVLLNESAAKDDYIRVIDESGEDYLYTGGTWRLSHAKRSNCRRNPKNPQSLGG